MRVAVVGGGPGGLFAATLIKRSDPAHEVTVFERNRAEDTFGFGVVFSDATLAGIHAADPVLRTALTEHGVHWDAIEVRLHGERHRCGGNGMAAVERKTLLSLLQRQAVGEGVDVRFSAEADVGDILAAGYDLVVAADGANSRFRERYRDVFGPSAETATAKFIWLGTTYPFDGLTFVHERGPHGVFAVHGYPIGNGVSTFIVETDEPSWTRGRPRRVRRHPAAGPERREEPRLPAAAVRRADRRPSAAGEQLPLGQLPHPPGTAGGGTGPAARPSPCSATPRTPPTSPSAPAPRWRWRTRSRWRRAGDRQSGLTSTPPSPRTSAAPPAGGQDPGLRPAQPVLVGALRPLPRHAAGLAVRLPLLHPVADRRQAAPPRP